MRTRSILAGILFLIGAIPSRADQVQDGKAIFAARCAACHNVNKNLTGPALAGVELRRNMDWIVGFVHSSQTMVKSGDTAALAVFGKFNKVVMPDHKDLTEADIKSIVEYIKSESKTGTTTAPFAKPLSIKPAYKPIRNLFLLGCYLLVVAGLVGVLYFAVVLKKLQLERKAVLAIAEK